MTMMKTLETVHSTVAEYIINFIAVVEMKYVCIVCMYVFFFSTICLFHTRVSCGYEQVGHLRVPQRILVFISAQN